MKDLIINKINLKQKLIYYIPAIPFLGLLPMIFWSALNDNICYKLCLSDPDLTVCCFLIQLSSVLILLMELGIILP